MQLNIFQCQKSSSSENKLAGVICEVCNPMHNYMSMCNCDLGCSLYVKGLSVVLLLCSSMKTASTETFTAQKVTKL